MINLNQSHYSCLRTQEVSGNCPFRFLHVGTSGRNLNVLQVRHIFFLLPDLFYVNACFACMCLCASRLSVVPLEVRGEHRGVWSWSYRQLWVTMCVLRMDPGCWVISLSLGMFSVCLSFSFFFFPGAWVKSSRLAEALGPGQRHLRRSSRRSNCIHTYHWLRKNRVISVSRTSY